MKILIHYLRVLLVINYLAYATTSLFFKWENNVDQVVERSIEDIAYTPTGTHLWAVGKNTVYCLDGNSLQIIQNYTFTNVTVYSLKWFEYEGLFLVLGVRINTNFDFFDFYSYNFTETFGCPNKLPESTTLSTNASIALPGRFTTLAPINNTILARNPYTFSFNTTLGLPRFYQSDYIRTNAAPHGAVSDCKTGYFSVDIGAGVVKHFSTPESSAPDYIFGAKNQTIRLSISSRGITMNKNCTIMWVGDSNVVFRYRAPFNSSSLPEAVLGSNSFTEHDPSFLGDYINTIIYNDTDSTLTVLSQNGGKIFKAITDEGTLGSVIYGNVNVIQNSSLVVTNNSGNYYVAGNLTLNNNSIIIIDAGQRIVIGGTECVELDGNLVVNVNNNNRLNTTVQVLQYLCLSNSSSFNTITVNGIDPCQTATPFYGETSMSLLIQQHSGECQIDSSGVNKKLIIGTVVGVLGFMACVFTLCGVIFILALIINKSRQRPRTAHV
eukprot:TRINITY_DN1433_c0_g1_i2.p1 TRINITY_DN1433_c0_g1~~TRINITY_DN1433_c0_g1_i2.p1  ORF type:complete len:494 (-),score=62.83 TRINITY_DN1433_c0_g1_i2:774-2255(-)